MSTPPDGSAVFDAAEAGDAAINESPTGPGTTSVFSYPNGFASASSAINTAYDAADFMGAVLQVTNGAVGMHEAGGAWYKTPVNVQSFTTAFTFQLAAEPTIPSITGFTFSVQNSNSTTNPMGNNGDGAASDANLCGYGVYKGQVAFFNSLAIKFDLNGDSQVGYPTGGSPNGTGLYINGAPESVLLGENDLNPYGINLYSGDIFSVNIVYDGTLLTMTILDTKTNAQGRYVWPIDIPTVTTSDTAYVGFTGGTIPAVATNILSWSYASGYLRLATPTFSVEPGSYADAQTVSITGPPGASIYYTTNGLSPTSSSTKYTGPISVSESEVIQAVAVQTGFSDSLVAAANYQIAPSGTPLIDFPKGFANAANLLKLVGYFSFSGSAIQMTDTKMQTSPGEVGAAWYAVPVNVQTFSTSFTLAFSDSNTNGAYGLGTTFTIQNQPKTTSTSDYGYVSGGPTALGYANDGLGYGYQAAGQFNGPTGGLLSSVAIKFDLSNNSTGLFMNGVTPSSPDVPITNVKLVSGNPIVVTLAYDGTTLTLMITDSVTKASFTKTWPIDIPTTVGADTAYVGFTAASGYFSANQLVQAWTYSN